MLIKNGTRYYEEKDLREYGRGYWDGRFNGYCEQDKFKSTTYLLGYTHGEADYNAFDAEPVALDPLDEWDLAELDKLTIRSQTLTDD